MSISAYCRKALFTQLRADLGEDFMGHYGPGSILPGQMELVQEPDDASNSA